MSKPKEVKVELIMPDGKWAEVYQFADDILREHMPKLRDAGARIAIAWNLAWTADADGRITLGKAKKASDLDRELHEFDFVILLNQEFYAAFDENQRRALIHHELSHCAVKTNDDGVVTDDRGRAVFRIRKHDVEEFASVVRAHGLWKADLQLLARAIAQNKEMPLLEHVAAGGATDGSH